MWKGETLKDTVKTIEKLLPHHRPAPLRGRGRAGGRRLFQSPRRQRGDGPNEHPTQTLLDLLTIRRERGTLDGLKVVLCGDLKHTRSTNSLTLGLSNFDVEFTFVSPKGFETSRWILDLVAQRGCKYTQSEDLQASLMGADVVYMCRIQKERFDDPGGVCPN